MAVKMKANELRLGNLFIEQHSNKIIEVIGLENNRVVFSGMFLENWQANPIPLTEEWLLKFGFENCSCGGYKIDGLHLGVDNDYNNKVIEYVHQLQNLYFALTGEELTWR